MSSPILLSTWKRAQYADVNIMGVAKKSIVYLW